MASRANPLWGQAIARLTARLTCLTILAVIGCGKDRAAAAADKEPASPVGLAPASASPPVAAPAPPGQASIEKASVENSTAKEAGAAKVSEASFDLEILPRGPYRAGQKGVAEIVLSAKPPYKVNHEYPYKFKVKASPEVTFASEVVTRDKVKLEQKRALMSVEFTAQSAGSRRVSGEFAFSVCTEERCMIEKRELSLQVEVQ
ncbi:MAG TPA: hypothetical protein VGJ84_18430 [Polyangiaceae bacterium]|jgi:hypothetical protein